MTDSSASKTVIERYMAAVGAGDVAAVRASFAPDATWWLRGELPISGTWRGRDTIMDDFFGTAMSFYEAGSVNIEVTSILADGEHVAAEWTSRARTTDGSPYENHCAAWFHVRDGHIQSVREYMDTMYWWAAMGYRRSCAARAEARSATADCRGSVAIPTPRLPSP